MLRRGDKRAREDWIEELRRGRRNDGRIEACDVEGPSTKDSGRRSEALPDEMAKCWRCLQRVVYLTSMIETIDWHQASVARSTSRKD